MSFYSVPHPQSAKDLGICAVLDGRLYDAGWAAQVASPLGVGIPLFGRAGSVLLLGPELQWSNEKPADPIEVRIFDGADSASPAVLYEDDGESAHPSASSSISFSWAEAEACLTIGARRGSGFSRMLTKRTFHLIRVRPGHGVGVREHQASSEPDAVVHYDGSAVTVCQWP